MCLPTVTDLPYKVSSKPALKYFLAYFLPTFVGGFTFTNIATTFIFEAMCDKFIVSAFTVYVLLYSENVKDAALLLALLLIQC